MIALERGGYRQRERSDEIKPPPRLIPLLVLLALALVFGAAFLDANPPGAAEQVYYLGNLGQSVFPTPTVNATYGQVSVACRTGWRFIEPVSTTVHAPDWTTIDTCHASAASRPGSKWSLSIKIGADAPLWLYNSSTICPASPVSTPTMEGTPGPHGALTTAFPFIWTQSNMGSEYPDQSVQCVPIPWDTNFQTQLQTFINTVAHHVASYNDSLLDHVVVTGVNAWTQENMQPHCTATGCGYPSGGGVTDLDNWASIIATPMCTASPGGCSAYYAKLGPAYDTIVGYWAKAFSSPTPFPFPNNVPLAAMFSNGANFPFDTSNATGLELLNQLVTDEGSRAIVMNNAAKVIPGMPPRASLDPRILCYQGIGTPCATPTPTATASIAFQEEGGVSGLPGGCNNLTALLSGASTDNSLYMEVYQNDINACF